MGREKVCLAYLNERDCLEGRDLGASHLGEDEGSEGEEGKIGGEDLEMFFIRGDENNP